jgi:catechol 2,3-dioxygenase-like lactoylglutathione lyase family enzyme
MFSNDVKLDLVKEMDQLRTGGFATLVPEFSVANLEISRRFWCDLLGFRVAYERPENRFAYLERGKAQVMLDERNGNWETGALEVPLGRGINFQIFVDSIEPILASLKAAKWPLFMDTHDACYRVGDCVVGSRQFLAQDPDGYLLRFAQNLGHKPVAPVP